MAEILYTGLQKAYMDNASAGIRKKGQENNMPDGWYLMAGYEKRFSDMRKVLGRKFHMRDTVSTY